MRQHISFLALRVDTLFAQQSRGDVAGGAVQACETSAGRPSDSIAADGHSRDVNRGLFQPDGQADGSGRASGGRGCTDVARMAKIGVVPGKPFEMGKLCHPLCCG